MIYRVVPAGLLFLDTANRTRFLMLGRSGVGYRGRDRAGGVDSHPALLPGSRWSAQSERGSHCLGRGVCHCSPRQRRSWQPAPTPLGYTYHFPVRLDRTPGSVCLDLVNAKQRGSLPLSRQNRSCAKNQECVAASDRQHSYLLCLDSIKSTASEEIQDSIHATADSDMDQPRRHLTGRHS